MGSTESHRKLEIALQFAAERDTDPTLTPHAYLERRLSREPALSALLDGMLRELLAEIGHWPVGERRRRGEAFLASARFAETLSTETAETRANAPSVGEDPTAPLHPKVPAQPAGGGAAGEWIDRRYRVVRLLGEGGFGKVLLVEDKLQRNQKLALKLLKTPRDAPEELLTRFRNEIVVLRALSHPGIPQIFNDGVTESGDFYFTMAFVEGDTLTSIIRRDAPLAPERIVRITKQILDVLDYAHKKGAIHRDLKPANVFVIDAGTPNERVKVLDFGIAKLLSNEGLLENAMTMNTEGAIGTPSYMAPEQMRNQAVDARTDMYALGIMIYQMCSGRMPFQGTTAMELLAAKLENPPTPLKDTQAPQWLSELVMKMLARERDKRPDTTAVLAALERLEAGQKKLSMRVAAVAAAVIVLALGFGTFVWSRRDGERPGTGQAEAARAAFELRAPNELFEGQAFWIDLDLGLPAAGASVATDWQLELPSIVGELGLVELDAPELAGARATLDLQVAERGHVAFEENGSFVSDGATLLRWSARRRFVATRVGELVLKDCKLRSATLGIEAPAKTLRLQVAALPAAGKPPGFGGAIGHFELSARLQPRELQVGSNSSLTLNFTGEGNFERFLAPEPGDLEAWTPLAPLKVADEAHWNRRAISYSLAPRGAGTLQLPPLEVAVFDTQTKRYEVLRTGAFELDVRETPVAPPRPDADGDGTPDDTDGCPTDPDKVDPGLCGCGKPDVDTDGDGTPDCKDQCPFDPQKQVPGACGCGKPDEDADGNGVIDCLEGALTRKSTDPATAFAWEQLEPQDGAHVASGAKSIEVRGLASRPLRSVVVAAKTAELVGNERRQFVVQVPLDSGARQTLEIVAIDAQGEELRASRVIVRDSASAPPGYSKRDDELGLGGLFKHLRHDATGIDLVQVASDGRGVRYVGVREVSWGEYERGGGAKLEAPRFLEGLNDRARHPVVDLSFENALDFCRRNGLELTTVDDFAAAARREGDARKYPWGDAWRADACNSKEGTFAKTAPCGSFPLDSSWCGVLDLSGNVRELCLESDGQHKALRGGSYESKPAQCELGYVPNVQDDFTGNETIGFRVALTLPL
ncbi:MAG: protein kinase [Planctomycetes bacterium]|nr:protein kinase [Planctomycetota bacterium]